VVQERLGHATPNITMTVYMHVNPTMQKEAADQVASAIFGT
jgi:integrase